MNVSFKVQNIFQNPNIWIEDKITVSDISRQILVSQQNLSAFMQNLFTDKVFQEGIYKIYSKKNIRCSGMNHL